MGRTCRSELIGVIALIQCVLCGNCHAQDTPSITDSLTASYKEAFRSLSYNVGTIVSDIETIRSVVTPIGEGDAIKLIQTLPGVSTGAEGSSAIFVRGGNLGNNIMSLDGVTLYGISHLMGMTSVISSDAVKSMKFQMGGMDADRESALSSVISLSTVNPSQEKMHIGGTINPFLCGLSVNGPVSKNTSILVSGRYSPVGNEYKSVKSQLSSEKGLHDFDASVYDIYGKLHHEIRKGECIDVSAFRSMDEYDIVYGKDSDRYKMSWDNTMYLLKYTKRHSEKILTEIDCSYNKFHSWQNSYLKFNGSQNDLNLKSRLKENTSEGKIIYDGHRNHLMFGGKYKLAEFMPGVSSYDGDPDAQRYNCTTCTLWGQYEYNKPEKFYFKAGARMNFYTKQNYTEKESYFTVGARMDFYPEQNYAEKESFREPEINIMSEYHISDGLKLSATFDRTAQFYHVLEGMPLGWSVDLIVPSDQALPVETAYQGYIGMTGTCKNHILTAGFYYKTMDNLVFFPNAATIFSSTISGWEENVEIGKGSSYGLESLYEYNGKKLSARISYTLSKTDRTFEALNNGKPFPAKFDRRHILNVHAQYYFTNNGNKKQGITSAFTFQSGHNESYKAFSYPSVTPDEEDFLIPYFSDQPNNLKMPDYIRFDIGYFRNWTSASGKIKYHLQAGVYNLLNRHNPFMLMFDDDSKQWQELSLIPIMPNMSFRVEF